FLLLLFLGGWGLCWGWLCVGGVVGGVELWLLFVVGCWCGGVGLVVWWVVVGVWGVLVWWVGGFWFFGLWVLVWGGVGLVVGLV
ncbi:hypothetical protein BV371_29025, partial [Klebsiella pneumoniae]